VEDVANFQLEELMEPEWADFDQELVSMKVFQNVVFSHKHAAQMIVVKTWQCLKVTQVKKKEEVNESQAKVGNEGLSKKEDIAVQGNSPEGGVQSEKTKPDDSLATQEPKNNLSKEAADD